MAKRFNITGVCVPAQHYMADVSRKFDRIMDMVEAGDYFIINRPRQYGKTTMLFRLNDRLSRSGEYLVFNISFEGLGDTVFRQESRFCQTFLSLLMREMRAAGHKTQADFLREAGERVATLDDLSQAISQFAQANAPKLVVLIDEVDKSSNNQLFVSFLGMLRNKYLRRHLPTDKTFHAVVLAGVHDIKSLKLKLRPDDEQKYNSPWNIAADFKVDMNLYPEEIKPMLDEYAADRGVSINTQAVAERLFYYTSGYPFLVSKLCKMFDEEMLPDKNTREWTIEDVNTAASHLVTETNVNFDSLIKNLENNENLYQLTYRIVVEAEQIPFVASDPTISLGAQYGIFKNGNGLSVHNKIYAEYIAAYMTSKLLTGGKSRDLLQYSGAYRAPDGSLDMEKLLSRFQTFMKEEYSKQDRDFLERQGRLLFLAFLKPILNGHGYSFKEPQISEERRLDVAITFYQHRYVAELKVWRGEAAHERGLAQLAAYLDQLALERGYLVIFDHGAVKSWRQEQVEVAGKSIFAVWV